jgi:hypothetical protein
VRFPALLAQTEFLAAWTDRGRQENLGIADLDHPYIFRVLGGDHHLSPTFGLVKQTSTGQWINFGTGHTILLISSSCGTKCDEAFSTGKAQLKVGRVAVDQNGVAAEPVYAWMAK